MLIGNKQLLDEVMVRLEKQFLVPAVYTIKEKANGTTDVHVFLHGTSVSHLSSMEFITEMLEDCEEDLRKVNKLADYFIEYFINGLQEESEGDAIQEVVSNLAYVYGKMVQVIRRYDEETKEDTVSFIPFQPELVITLNTSQLKEEYEHRFDSEESPDILVDLRDIIKTFETGGVQKAKELAEKLDRNINVTSFEENEPLK